MSGKHIGASIFAKSNEFVLKLAATPLQTSSNKFINTKIDAPSVTSAHSRFARSSNMMFPASRVSAQDVKKIEIGKSQETWYARNGEGQRYALFQYVAAKQAQKIWRLQKSSSACPVKFCSFIHSACDTVLTEKIIDRFL